MTFMTPYSSNTATGWSYFYAVSGFRLRIQMYTKKDIQKRFMTSEPTVTCPPSTEPSHKIKLADDLGQLHDSKVFSDFVLVLGDGQELRVHRNILAARSPVFMAMFTQENFKEAQTGRCDIPDVDGPTMDLLLRFIYGCLDPQVLTKNPEMTLKLVVAADKYDLAPLITICAAVLRGSITADNAADVLLVAHQYGLAELEVQALDCILRNRQEFLRSGQLEKVRQCGQEIVDEIVKDVRNRGQTKEISCDFCGARIKLTHP